MATVTTGNPASIANKIQRLYSKELLDYIKLNLVLAQFAIKSPLPQKAGAKTIRLFRFGSPSTSGVQTLSSEGVAISEANYRELAIEYVDADLVQYGQVIAISDIEDATSLFNMVDQAVKTNGEDAALHCDTLIRNELKIHTGTVGNVNYATKNFVYAQAASAWATVYNSGTYSANYVCTPTDLLDAATALKIQSAPRVGGYYIAAAAPQVTRDLMEQDDVWQRVSAYSAKEQVFQGEIGKLYGVRVLETTNPWRTAGTQGTYNSSGVVFSTFVFGANTFGTPDLSGNSPHQPKVYMVRGADKSDPLNQVAAKVGFKTMWAAKLLQPLWLCELYSQTGYGQ